MIELEQLRPEYGAERRRLSIAKLRGSKFRGGYHDYTIVTGGLEVFPRLVASEHHQPFEPGDASERTETSGYAFGAGGLAGDEFADSGAGGDGEVDVGVAVCGGGGEAE